MRKLFLLSLSLFFVFQLTCQDPYQTIPLEIKSIKKIKGLADDQGNSCLVYFRNEYIYFTVIQDKEGTSSHAKLPSPSEGELKLVGTQFDVSNFYFYYRDKYTDNSLILYVVQKEDIEQSKQEIFPLPISKKDKFVDTYNYDNQIYLLYSNKKTYDVTVLHLDKPKSIVSNILPSTQLFHNFLKKGKFKNIYLNDEPLISKATGKKKLFMPSPDKMILVSDKPVITELAVGPTEVLFLDLKDNKLSKKRIPLNQEIVSAQRMTSYLFEEKIYRLMITADFVQLSIYDLVDFKLLKNYFYPKGEKIEMIANQTIYQGAVDFPPIQEFDKPKPFHRNLNRGIPALSVSNADSNQVKIRIGSVFFKQNGGPPMMGPNGVLASPPTALGANQTIISFDVFLDKDTWEIRHPQNYTDPGRLEAEFLESLFPTNEFVTGINGNEKAGKPTSFSYPWIENKKIFGYFDKKKKELKLYKF